MSTDRKEYEKEKERLDPKDYAAIDNLGPYNDMEHGYLHHFGPTFLKLVLDLTREGWTASKSEKF